MDWKGLRSATEGVRDILLPRNAPPRRILRDALVTAALLGGAALICSLMNLVLDGDQAVPMVFVLAVLLTARFTEGYLFSLMASIISVFGVNYAFTYPYFEFNFTITGYPFTFLTMFTVSVVVSMLTAQVKRQSRLEAEAETEKMKANLLRSVSHDLRTPLTAIIGSASAVLENYDKFSDEDKRELIGQVRDDAQWLMRLVENILSITRMNNGPVRIKKSPEAVEEIASEVVGKFKKRFPNTQVHVRVPAELVMVPMDAVLIEQVIINLMENAVFHGEHVTRIDLSVYCQGREAIFCVEDDGCGIDPRVLPRIFEEMFPHAQELGGDAKRNMGIGLSVCMSIVRSHGGRMMAENRKEGGVRMSFALPLEEEPTWLSEERC